MQNHFGAARSEERYSVDADLLREIKQVSRYIRIMHLILTSGAFISCASSLNQSLSKTDLFIRVTEFLPLHFPQSLISAGRL